MFQLCVLEDKVKTQPDQFDRDPTEVLIEQIEIKYCNKILHEVGLCICFYDFIDVGDPFIYPAEGAAHQHVKFRLVIYRPFTGELLTGKIVGSSKDGLKVSMDIFENIHIPSYLFQPSTVYNPTSSLWTWKYGEGEDVQDFVMELQDEIRFRVQAVSFSAVTSSAKGFETTTTSITRMNHQQKSALVEMTGDASALLRRRSSSINREEDNAAPMQIIGSINDSGLGLVSWWS